MPGSFAMSFPRSHLTLPARILQRTACLLLLTLACSGGLSDTPVPIEDSSSQAPPPFPPVLLRPVEPMPERPRPHDNGPTLYSIGQPTDEEQLYLEFMNRARANPAAEGERLRDTTDPDVLSAYDFFDVDLDLMVSEFAAIDPAPPLAMNERLLIAARLHTQDMFENEFQGHSGSDGSTLGQRVTAQGYDWASLAENVFSFGKSVWHGHAGFNVDWGPGGAGGMQAGRGHRVNIHNANSREVGVGVVLGSNGSVGPQLVTQDFGSQHGATPFLTGVAWYDLNGNGFYDIGEGIGGITVSVDGSTFYAVTADSGGYAVPVPGNGTYTITFNGPNLPEQQPTVVVTGSANLKIDYRPAYNPPTIAGPNPASLGVANAYTFTPVGAAIAHQIEQTRLAPYTRIEGAEEGLMHVTAVVSPGYDVISTSIRASGTRSFHLAHPAPATDQFLTLNPVLKPSDTSQLSFQSRLGWASVNQVARAQISTDDGHSWTDLWSRPGTDGAGQSSFQPVSVSLAPFAGLPVRVRFVYDHVSGTYFPQTDDGVGWYIDDIAISNALELLDPALLDVPSGNAFTFTPITMDDHTLRARAQLSGGRFLPWGPTLVLAVTDALPPSIRIVGPPTLDAAGMTIRFSIDAGAASSFEIHGADRLDGFWLPVANVTIRDLGDGQFEADLPVPPASILFYRVFTH
jgi:hypothetical protein